MKLASRLVVATVLAGLTFPALAQERDPDKAAYEYRHSILVVTLGNLAPIAGMVKGRIPFDGGQMAMRAERIRVMSTMIEEAFQRDTRGAELDTRAKDGIWDNYTDFVAKAQRLGEAAEALSAAAVEGAEPAKEAFKKLAGACKACHDDYRHEDD